MQQKLLIFLWLIVGTTASLACAADDVASLLDDLRSVGPKSEGQAKAAQAWEKLAKSDATALPQIFSALDGANPLAANWILTATDAVAERTLKTSGELPVERLQQYLADVQHDSRGRRRVYEWLCRLDPKTPGRLLPQMLDDPSVELRRDAVARLIDEAEQAEKGSEPANAVPVYRRALLAARDLDQVRLLADRLKKAGEEVDLARHFGFIRRWHVIGPFDNTDEKGYDVAYPPEEKIDLKASCEGKHGDVSWKDYVSDEAYGLVDLNKALGEEKEVAGYATTIFLAEKPMTVQFRTTTFDAVKLWLNGRLIDEHNVYHGGSEFDQYVAEAELRAGPNVLLMKVCQNAQTQSWAKHWSFKLRVCDRSGTAILSADRR